MFIDFFCFLRISYDMQKEIKDMYDEMNTSIRKKNGYLENILCDRLHQDQYLASI